MHVHIIFTYIHTHTNTQASEDVDAMEGEPPLETWTLRESHKKIPGIRASRYPVIPAPRAFAACVCCMCVAPRAFAAFVCCMCVLHLCAACVCCICVLHVCAACVCCMCVLKRSMHITASSRTKDITHIHTHIHTQNRILHVKVFSIAFQDMM